MSPSSFLPRRIISHYPKSSPNEGALPHPAQEDAAGFVESYARTCYTFDDDPEAELVARLIWIFVRGPRILDLGCGPVHHLLSLFFPDESRSVGVDLLQENLDYVRAKLEAKEIEPAAILGTHFAHRALARCSQPADTAAWIRERYRGIADLRVGDVRRLFPEYRGAFDSVIQIGCLLALDSVKDLRRALRHVATYLRDGGIFLSIGWLQDRYQERPLHFNGHLSAQVSLEGYCQELQSSGLRLLEFGKSVNLDESTRRLGYTSIVWAALVK